MKTLNDSLESHACWVHGDGEQFCKHGAWLNLTEVGLSEANLDDLTGAIGL